MRAPTLWLAGTGLAGVGAGLLGALALRGPAPDEGVRDEVAALSAELDSLRDELDAERATSRGLSDELEHLRSEVGEAKPVAAADAPAAAAPAPEAEPEASASPHGGSDEWFDGQGLLALGTPSDEVERLRERYEQSQLQLLYLRDQATREGWLKTPRFREGRNQIQTALREDLDDAAYDRLLYATGRPNRVLVAGVFADSPAARAGFQTGDAILRYADRAIFGSRELQQATAEGRAGSTVAVDVARGGSVLRLYVPQGPLGMRLQPGRLPPQPE